MKTNRKSLRPIRSNALFAAGARGFVCALFASALLLAGCGKDDTEPAPKLTISPAPGTLTFGSNAEESYRFEVTANGPEWQAVSDQPWCKVEMDAKAGTFTVSAEENYETTAPAPATITVTAGENLPLTLTATQAEARYDIYMAGSSSTDGKCYWKNGQVIPLQLPEQRKIATSTSICISDNSVYIGGDFGGAGCYWKDNEIHFFPQPEGMDFSRCEGIAISDGKVHGVGWIDKDGKTSLSYWTDTFLYQFDLNPAWNTRGWGIALSDGSIYLTGNAIYDNGNATTAFYLKLKDFQEDPVLLEPLPGYTYTHARDIVVSDGKVYIAGYCYNQDIEYIAGYWLDGVFMPIEDPSSGFYATAEAIAVENGTVHIAGSYMGSESKENAYYWNKEQGSTLLPQPAGSSDESWERDIAVFGNKVFVEGGYSMNGDYKACYWINGERFDLNDPNGKDTFNSAMTVVKR